MTGTRDDDLTRFTGGLMWVTLAFTAVLGVGRSYVAEREQRVLDGLLVSPVPRVVLLAAKAIAAGIDTLALLPEGPEAAEERALAESGRANTRAKPSSITTFSPAELVMCKSRSKPQWLLRCKFPLWATQLLDRPGGSMLATSHLVFQKKK